VTSGSNTDQGGGFRNERFLRNLLGRLNSSREQLQFQPSALSGFSRIFVTLPQQASCLQDNWFISTTTMSPFFAPPLFFERWKISEIERSVFWPDRKEKSSLLQISG